MPKRIVESREEWRDFWTMLRGLAGCKLEEGKTGQHRTKNPRGSRRENRAGLDETCRRQR